MIINKYPNHTEYRNDKGHIHRTDGPAVEYDNGNKYWYINGQPHRIGGPATENTISGYKKYYLNGIEHSFEEWDRLRKLLILI